MTETAKTWVIIAVFTVVVFAVGFAAGHNRDSESPTVCTQESHYLTTPFDGGTAHDGRTVYTGECTVYSN